MVVKEHLTQKLQATARAAKLMEGYNGSDIVEVVRRTVRIGWKRIDEAKQNDEEFASVQSRDDSSTSSDVGGTSSSTCRTVAAANRRLAITDGAAGSVHASAPAHDGPAAIISGCLQSVWPKQQPNNEPSLGVARRRSSNISWTYLDEVDLLRAVAEVRTRWRLLGVFKCTVFW